jgi:4-hydroxy-2-oxoheptanedioate aldolase
VTEALLPALHDGATITNVTSELGALANLSDLRRRQLTDPGLTRQRLASLMEECVATAARAWGTDAYGVSKAALNALTRILVRELAPRRIRVNATCPGWPDVPGRARLGDGRCVTVVRPLVHAWSRHACLDWAALETRRVGGTLTLREVCGDTRRDHPPIIYSESRETTMRGKRIRDKLRAGRPVFTTVLRFHAPRLVEMLARSGADQIFLDAEHGPLSEAECEEMVRAADLYDVPVVIRVPVNTPHVILRYLDIGTSAIMVPHVTTRADAECAVRAVKYPPEGTRSFAPGRGAELLHLGPAEYVRRANDETVVYALFEDVAGIDEIEAICRVPGIDGMAVGVYDLAASMGHPGEPWRDNVQAVVERVLQTCRRSRMPFGTVPRDRADLGRQIERGCQLITVATIEWGIQATRDTVAELSALGARSGA